MAPNREYWCLIGLEATLFFSLPCWELTVGGAWPAENPIHFAAVVIGTALVAALCCHIGPAFLASTVGNRRPRLWWILGLWLVLGYLHWLGTLIRDILLCTRYLLTFSQPAEVAAVILVLTGLCLIVWIRNWWTYAIPIFLAFSVALLILFFATSWSDLWVQARRISPERDDEVIQAMLLSAAPAIIIAWRIGQFAQPRRIWTSGMFGVALPLTVSVSLASVATMAGLRSRHVIWRGFEAAMLGVFGEAKVGLFVLTSLTVLGPALVAAVSIRELTPHRITRTNTWLIVFLIACSSYGLSFLQIKDLQIASIFESQAHDIWAWSLIGLGALAGALRMLLKGLRMARGNET